MRTLFLHLKTHALAYLLAILTGAVMLGPQVYFMIDAGKSYQGIGLLGTDAESHYLSRIHAASLGRGVDNPFTFEEKGTLPSTTFTYIETVLAFPSTLFHVSVHTMNLWYKFLLPAIAFLLAYLLAFRVTRRRSAALAAASLGIVGISVFSFADLKHFFMLDFGYENFQHLANYSRPVNPEASGLFFFAYLNLLWSFWTWQREDWQDYKKKMLIVVGLALLFGASFYVYFYTWAFMLLLNGLFFLLFVALRRFRDAIHVAFITTIGFLLATPYILNLIAFTTHPYYADISKTLGFILTHSPRISTAGVVTAAAFIGTLLYKRYKKEVVFGKEEIFIGVLILAAFISINQQVLTGRLLQEGHFHWYFNIPIFGLAISWLIVEWGGRLKNRYIVPIGIGICIFLSFGTAILTQVSSYRAMYSLALFEQPYATVFNWLNANAPAGSVVLANNDISELTPVYTSQYVYWNKYDFTYLTPRFRVMHALFMYLKLYDIPPSKMPEAAFHPPTDAAEAAYAQVETATLVGDHKSYLNGFYPDKMAIFNEWFASGPFEKRLHEYRIDYIIVDMRHDSLWLKVIPKSAKKVFEEGPMILYQL